MGKLFAETKCPHCNFLRSLFPEEVYLTISDREFDLYSKMYEYRHNGKEYCDFEDEKRT